MLDACTRVRQQRAKRDAVGLAGLPELDREAHCVRAQIMSLAQALPALSVGEEHDVLLYSAF